MGTLVGGWISAPCTTPTSTLPPRTTAFSLQNLATLTALSPFFFLGQVIWPALEADFGWTKVHGPRVSDAYFMPMGVVRGQNKARCRIDYYDSFRQVGSPPPPPCSCTSYSVQASLSLRRSVFFNLCASGERSFEFVIFVFRFRLLF